MPPSTPSRTRQHCQHIGHPLEPPEIVYSGGDCPRCAMRTGFGDHANRSEWAEKRRVGEDNSDNAKNFQNKFGKFEKVVYLCSPFPRGRIEDH